MNDLQRGEKIIEIFLEIKEKYGATHDLQQGLGYFHFHSHSHSYDKNCGTAGCIGSVLAHHLVGKDGYSVGAASLAKALQLKIYNNDICVRDDIWNRDILIRWVVDSGLWHNKYHHRIFSSGDEAYDDDETGVDARTTTLSSCCDHWIAFGKRLIKKEEEKGKAV